MGRVIKILLYLVVLFFVFFWLSTVFDSCKKNQGNVITDAVETVEDASDDLVDGAQDLIEDADDEFFDDEEEEIDYEELDAEEDFEDEDIYEEEETTAPVIEEKPVIQSTQTPARSTSSGGNYLVIAGSYLLKSNALEMTAKLKKMGFDAEVVNFDNSELHTVTSGRYATIDAARKDARKLDGRGIDNYVHRRK